MTISFASVKDFFFHYAAEWRMQL